QHANGTAIDKTPHRVIEEVITDCDKIDVMREASREFSTCRNRRDFNELDISLHDPFPEHRNVAIKSRNMGMLARLANCKKSFYFGKQVVSYPNDSSILPSCSKADNLRTHRYTGIVCDRGFKGPKQSIDRKFLATEGYEVRPPCGFIGGDVPATID